MKCPNCNLYNPETTIKCDCGYVFQENTGVINTGNVLKKAKMLAIKNAVLVIEKSIIMMPKMVFNDYEQHASYFYGLVIVMRGCIKYNISPEGFQEIEPVYRDVLNGKFNFTLNNNSCKEYSKSDLCKTFSELGEKDWMKMEKGDTEFTPLLYKILSRINEKLRTKEIEQGSITSDEILKELNDPEESVLQNEKTKNIKQVKEYKESFFEKNTWWRWPLIPFGCLFGSMAATFVFVMAQYFSFRFFDLLNPDGWYIKKLLPFSASLFFGIMWTTLAIKIAPKKKIITSIVMACILIAMLILLLLNGFAFSNSNFTTMQVLTGYFGTIVTAIWTINYAKNNWEDVDD